MVPRSRLLVASLLGLLLQTASFVGAGDRPPAAADEAPIALHPRNPHYFLFRGRATALVTSAEHYGAVLNADFDYVKYLDALAADGLNLTRTFSGAYVEPQGAFDIAENTLAPKPGRLVCPWARSDAPGYAGGGAKFDLSRWDERYFERLRDFVAQASRRGIVVEFTLFCPMYKDDQWKLSPLHASNNVNGVGSVGRDDVHTLDRNGGLLAVQEALVRKCVAELNAFDNVLWEICNEPYFGGVTMAWQHRIADVIVETERTLPRRHLITQNVANGSAKIERPHPAVSVFNFHYAHPPTAVGVNFALDRVIGDNETGFKGTGDDHYRMEAWEFLLAGGGLFNHLDYSFAVGHEDGTFRYPPKQPGGGNAGFRRQLRVLKDFLHAFDLTTLRPARDKIQGTPPRDARLQMLAEPDRQYAAYFRRAAGFEFALELRPGEYDVRWLDAVTGKELLGVARRRHDGGPLKLKVPDDVAEVALSVRAAGADAP